MQYKKVNESSSSAVHPIVLVHSPEHIVTNQKSDRKGHYFDNLTFTNDEGVPLTCSNADVYKPLSEQVPQNNPLLVSNGSNVSSEGQRQPLSRYLIWKAILTGILLVLIFLLGYYWVSIRYIDPTFGEIYESPQPMVQLAPGIPLVTEKSKKLFQRRLVAPSPYEAFVPRSTWQVDYDLPDGIPVAKLSISEIDNSGSCPWPEKFALALNMEEGASTRLAESWFKKCGPNVAYFRVDGDPSFEDIDRLLVYLKNAKFLPLKAELSMERDASILDNPNFLKTRRSDEIIRKLEMSGFVEANTITELVEAAPYVEELTISGDEICKTLRRSRTRSHHHECSDRLKVTWSTLQKLHIIHTQECREMYDLIYSCWDMPALDTLQVRRSIITGVNSNYIRGILDKYRITKVDFADNSCFDDTVQSVPFMCQASV